MREPFAPDTLAVLLRCFVTHKAPTRALSCLLLGFSELRVLPRFGQAVLKGAVFLPSEDALDVEDGNGRCDLEQPEALDTMAEWLSSAVGDEALAKDVVALAETVHNYRLALPRAFYVEAATNLCARCVCVCVV